MNKEEILEKVRAERRKYYKDRDLGMPETESNFHWVVRAIDITLKTKEKKK